MSTREGTSEGTAVPRGRRRTPQQDRSRARLEQVLRATSALVTELGPDEVTTAVIAERAGVSVAWIYRYFENRQAIFDGIVLDAVHRQFEETQAALVGAAEGDWREGVRAVLAVNVGFFQREPAFARLWTSEFRSTAMLASNRVHDDDQATWIYETMSGLGLLAEGDASRRACRLVVAITDRGLELAFELDPRGDPIVVQQVGDALIAVLEPYVVDGSAG